MGGMTQGGRKGELRETSEDIGKTGGEGGRGKEQGRCGSLTEVPGCRHYMSAEAGSPSNSGLSGRLLPLLDALQPCRPVLQLLGLCMNALPPAATPRAEPPCQAVGACSVVARLAFILTLIPLCGYARAQRLKGVAFASGLPNTERTAWSAWLHAVTWPCRPAVLLSSWTIGAEPEDLLVALQPYSVRKVPKLCITWVIPLCQEGSHFRLLALCKGWLLSLFAAFCICFCTL